MTDISSWDTATWLWAGLWCAMILLGILKLLGVRRQGEQAERKPDFTSGLLFIGLGLFQLLTTRPGIRSPAWDVGFGVFVIAVGLWVLLFQSYFTALRRRRYDARLADRLARGEDAYFEELRELEAYPPDAPPASTMQYVLGTLFILFGGALIATSLGGGTPR